MGINYRVIRSDVAVNIACGYRDFFAVRARFDLENWGAALLRGSPGDKNPIYPTRSSS